MCAAGKLTNFYWIIGKGPWITCIYHAELCKFSRNPPIQQVQWASKSIGVNCLGEIKLFGMNTKFSYVCVAYRNVVVDII